MIGQRIKTLRENNGLTQDELGEILGFKRQQISAFEIDLRMPTTLQIIAFAKVFQCSADYILGLKDEE